MSLLRTLGAHHQTLFFVPIATARAARNSLTRHVIGPWDNINNLLGGLSQIVSLKITDGTLTGAMVRLLP